MANSASSSRVETPVLSKMFDRWRLTVSSLSENCLAMSRLRAAFDDAAHHFELARSEPVGLALRHGGLLHQVVQGRDQVHDALAADPVIAGENGADGGLQMVGERVLEHDAARADVQRLDDLLAW